MEYKPKIVKIENVDMKLQIWDTAGQEKFRSVALNFYKGATGAILIFDLTNPESLDHLKHWNRQLRIHGGDDIVKILVGTKADLAVNVLQENIDEAKEDFDLKYFEVSAKENTNVKECFDYLSTEIKKKFYHPTADNSVLSQINSENNPVVTFKLGKGRRERELTDSNSTCC